MTKRRKRTRKKRHKRRHKQKGGSQVGWCHTHKCSPPCTQPEYRKKKSSLLCGQCIKSCTDHAKEYRKHRGGRAQDDDGKNFNSKRWRQLRRPTFTIQDWINSLPKNLSPEERERQLCKNLRKIHKKQSEQNAHLKHIHEQLVYKISQMMGGHRRTKRRKN